MIEPRNAFTITRQRQLRAELATDGSIKATIGPVAPGCEYLSLVIGSVRRGQVVEPDEVVAAAQDLIDRIRAAGVGPAESC